MSTSRADEPTLRALTQKANADFARIPPARLPIALPPEETAPEVRWIQSRLGEERRGLSPLQELRAVYADPSFWASAALLPRNNLSDVHAGRPKDYPDWLLFLCEGAGGVTGVACRHAAYRLFDDAYLWPKFVEDVDQFVPDGMTRLGDLAPRGNDSKPMAEPKTQWNEKVSPMRRRRSKKPNQGNNRQIRRAEPTAVVEPPKPHHLDYFATLWRGIDKKTREPLPEGHPWHGLRRLIYEAFERNAILQAQAMGLLAPGQPFRFDSPDPTQYVGFDGVVFPMTKRGSTDACEQHVVAGDKQVYGTKFTIASTRIVGQYGSRVILGFAHTGKSQDSKAASEQAAVRDMALRLRDLSEGGIQGTVVDSAVRGADVEYLQRHGIVVVNYPHAASNPDGGPGKRLNPNRREKSYLRHIARHNDRKGRTCLHWIYAVGGELVVLDHDAEGDPVGVRLDPFGYKSYANKNGTCREYFMVTITCPHAAEGSFTDRIALFHNDPVSDDPTHNWGEVVRVFAPSSERFKRLYGMRNDTESRHTDLKSRMKYLPRDVVGQELRMLMASIASNARAWQIHLQAHGKPNTIDDTT